ncbi:MAG: primase C-terminal domain-containing protein, partial [Alphaproteobacteria bacterium]|nr:primase C-terminal domain-containing protein [Alphaproteobacteria bacterium]
MAYALFRGYIATDGKAAIEKFKGVDKLKSYRDVYTLDSYAGVLNEETVLIDIDNEAESQILYQICQDNKLRCRIYRTSRGCHFLFKNTKIDKCGTHVKLACGLTADIKIGSKNSYSVLKKDGQERQILSDIFPDEDYQEVPAFLLPVKSKVEFLGMGDGDGRNQQLFNYILTLQSNGFSVDEARETLTVINRYILSKPLPESELETIMRDDAFDKPTFYDGKTFLFDKFATFLKNHSHIIKLDGVLHIYRDGIYVDGRELIENEMIKYIPNLNKAKRTEVYEYLNVMIEKNAKPSPANLIAFKNGVYDTNTGEFMDFSESMVMTNRIEHNYNPNAESELVDSTLNKLACQDQEIRKLLEECIGYCFYRRNELGKAFVLTGGGSNGKSTYLNMVKDALGDCNIAALDLGELKSEYKTAELYGKLANIGDDIADNFIPDSSTFKKLVTGDRLSARKIYCPPFEFNNYAKMLFSANDIPRIKDRTGAVQRRLVIIPFNATFTKSDPDYRPYIKYELRKPENMEYFIKIGIDGLQRVLENQAFSQSQKVDKELAEYEETNNPIVGFMKE